MVGTPVVATEEAAGAEWVAAVEAVADAVEWVVGGWVAARA